MKTFLNATTLLAMTVMTSPLASAYCNYIGERSRETAYCRPGYVAYICTYGDSRGRKFESEKCDSSSACSNASSSCEWANRSAEVEPFKDFHLDQQADL